jgi:hypothetical protein
MQRAYAHAPIPSETPIVPSELRDQELEVRCSGTEEAVHGARGQLLSPGRALLRLACFIAIVVAFIFAANALISVGIRDIKTSSLGAWNQLMQGRVNADVIISGSSRAAYHYDPRVIESVTGRTAFNIGRAGTQTDVQLAVLKAYLEHNRKPKLIVHNLDAFSFVTSREIYDPVLYVPYLRDEAIYGPLRRIDPSMTKSRYIPLYGYVVEDMNFTWVEGLRALLGFSPKEDYFLGFSPRDIKWSDEFRKFKASKPHGVEFPVEAGGVEALEQLIEECRANEIPLVLVYSPEFSGMQEMTNNRAEIFAQFQNLASKYHVPLWDYSDWKSNGDRKLFYNSQHLNATGAELFSGDLANRLKGYFADRQGTAGRLGASEAEAHANRN